MVWWKTALKAVEVEVIEHPPQPTEPEPEKEYLGQPIISIVPSDGSPYIVRYLCSHQVGMAGEFILVFFNTLEDAENNNEDKTDTMIIAPGKWNRSFTWTGFLEGDEPSREPVF